MQEQDRAPLLSPLEQGTKNHPSCLLTAQYAILFSQVDCFQQAQKKEHYIDHFSLVSELVTEFVDGV